MNRETLLILPTLLIAIATLVPAELHSRVIDVPGKTRTIREGIERAATGDTVMLSPGTYRESRIDFRGKKITVMGKDPTDSAIVAKTIVFGDSAGCVFYFHSGEDSTSVLTGLTISGGKCEYGGGIACLNNSSPTIRRNVIAGNLAGRSGGGIYCENSSPKIRENRITANRSTLDAAGISVALASYPVLSGNVITGNIAGDYGGGVSSTGISSPVLTGNTIRSNSAKNGGAISCYEASITIDDNLITGNSAVNGGGIFCSTFSRVSIINTTLSENSASIGKEIMIADGASPSTVEIRYSVVRGGGSAVHVEEGNVLDWGVGVIKSDPSKVQFFQMGKPPQADTEPEDEVEPGDEP